MSDSPESAKPEFYSGALTPEQVAAGINAALRNARRLADDAKLLLDAESHATATSLAALSIEESGKVSILRSLAVARTEIDLRRCWKEYRTHVKKNASWLLPVLAGKGARSLEDLRPLFDEAADHPMILDRLKQSGFYTDCLADGQWSEPHEAIDHGFAKALVWTADMLAARNRGNVTSREIELWIQHLKPVWMREVTSMKKGLSNWRRAMEKEGLAEPDVGFDDFVWGNGERDDGT